MNTTPEEDWVLRRAKEINDEINAGLPKFTRQTWDQLTHAAAGALLKRAQDEWDAR